MVGVIEFSDLREKQRPQRYCLANFQIPFTSDKVWYKFICCRETFGCTYLLYTYNIE